MRNDEGVRLNSLLLGITHGAVINLPFAMVLEFNSVTGVPNSTSAVCMSLA